MNSSQFTVHSSQFTVFIRILLLSIITTLSSFQLPTSDFQLPTSDFQPPTSNFHLLKSISIEAKDIETDKLGNLYVITKTNQLYKYTPNGELLGTLNYKYLGNISSIDASNPLEVYVFYKEQNEVLFLDNTLAYRGEIILTDYGIAQPSAVARTFDNGVWIFDQSDLQLKKISKSGELQQQSGNIKQIVNGNISPFFISENGDRVFVNDSTVGIMVFNVFASYIKTIPVKGSTSFKVIDDKIFFNRAGNLFSYDIKNYSENSFGLPDSTGIRDISIERERLYLLKQNSVDIYSY